jgi:hypothetical protein
LLIFSHDQIPKQINVAQAFINNGVYSKRPYNNKIEHQRKNGLEDDDEFEYEGHMSVMDDEEPELIQAYENQIDEEVSSPTIDNSYGHLNMPPSRWDDSTHTHTEFCRSVNKKQTTHFGQFFMDMLDGMLCMLWPESHLLTLPKFLMESKFFDALKVSLYNTDICRYSKIYCAV